MTNCSEKEWKWVQKSTNSQRLNNTLVSDNQVQEEIKKETQKFLALSENGDAAYRGLWDTIRAILRRKFMSQKCLHQSSRDFRLTESRHTLQKNKPKPWRVSGKKESKSGTKLMKQRRKVQRTDEMREGKTLQQMLTKFRTSSETYTLLNWKT